MKPHPYPSKLGQDVYFTQIMYPSLTKSDQWIERPKEVYARAIQLYANGFYLAAINEHDIITISCSDGDRVIEQLRCVNGPTVPLIVDEVINKSYERLEDKNGRERYSK